MPEALLSIRGIGIRFGGLTALADFSLDVAPGELVGLIGPNGAGKTTVFNVVTGVYPPSRGDILLAGHSLRGLSPHRIARLGVARTFQNIRLFANMSALENVLVAASWARRGTFWTSLCGIGRGARAERAALRKAEALLEFVGISHFADAPATSLPYGLQRRLEIARALMTNPNLLLLDEPAAGMNATEKESLRELVEQVAAKGVSILVIEHDMRFVMNLCRRIAVLDHGEELLTGSPAEVQAHPQVIAAYLGADMEE